MDIDIGNGNNIAKLSDIATIESDRIQFGNATIVDVEPNHVKLGTINNNEGFVNVLSNQVKLGPSVTVENGNINMGVTNQPTGLSRKAFNNIKIGNDLSINGNENVAIGQNIQNVSGSNAIIIGNDVSGVGDNNAIVIGRNASGSSNSVSIGTESGNVSFNGVNNICIGFQSGNSATNGDNNVFVGAMSGFSNQGNENCFIGNNCGKNIQHAENNVFIGNGCGLQQQRGLNNVFIGNNCCSGIVSSSNSVCIGPNISTVGDNCVVIGKDAGNSTSTGNVYIGSQAGNTDSGNTNVFIGKGSGTSNTGNNNVFLGEQAGGENSTGVEQSGSSNVFLGIRTGVGNSGSSNVFLGYQTGSTSSGNNNVFLGTEAGKTNSGSSNIIVGNNAGESNSGSSNILVGLQSGKYLSGANNVTIGNSSGMNGINCNNNSFIGNNTGTNLITGDNNVAIGNNCLINAINIEDNIGIGVNTGVNLGVQYLLSSTIATPDTLETRGQSKLQLHSTWSSLQNSHNTLNNSSHKFDRLDIELVNVNYIEQEITNSDVSRYFELTLSFIVDSPDDKYVSISFHPKIEIEQNFLPRQQIIKVEGSLTATATVRNITLNTIFKNSDGSFLNYNRLDFIKISSSNSGIFVPVKNKASFNNIAVNYLYVYDKTNEKVIEYNDYAIYHTLFVCARSVNTQNILFGTRVSEVGSQLRQLISIGIESTEFMDFTFMDICIGYRAGKNAINSSINIYIGAFVGNWFGYNTFRKDTKSSNNIFIGKEAAYNFRDGADNTIIIGGYRGSSEPSEPHRNNCIIIGNLVSQSKIVGENSININDLIYGNRSSVTIDSNLNANSYTPFTGSHIVFSHDFIDIGMICSSNGEFITQHTIDSATPNVIVSYISHDKKCIGVCSEKLQSSKKYRINSLGEGCVWVCNINGNFENGDYITTSTTCGFGQKQNDDLLHNYTVAKITQDCDFNPSFTNRKVLKKKPVMYDIIDENGEFVGVDIKYETELDIDNNMIYTETNEQIPVYETKMIKDTFGNEYTAALVACTYHCG